jgi:pyruvate kinase
MRRAKIVCTLGPSSESEETIEALVRAGMNVARLNFSHGEYDFHRTLVNRIRSVSEKLETPIAILQDLQGPKIRCQTMEDGQIRLPTGSRCTITTDSVIGTAERFGTSYELLPRDVQAGSIVLLDDGNLTLKVVDVDGTEVHCQIIHGGILRDKKGINLPNSRVSAPSLTPKDIRDVHFGAEMGVDAVALSFVRSRQDIRMLRRELTAAKSRPLVVAKLEKPQAIEQLDGIIEESDGVMVARGDLGVEMPTEKVPMIQKQIIEEANRRGRFVIVATQMLESMIQNPRPTRAEASDVANAVLDGAGALMLSGETAVSIDPVNTVATMDRIIIEAEQSDRAHYMQTSNFLSTQAAQDFQNAVSLAAVRAAHELAANCIAVYTTSGATARLVSEYRPREPIIAFVPNVGQQRRLAFAWGVQTEIAGEMSDIKEVFQAIDSNLLGKGTAKPGETVVLCSKTPLLGEQRTNALYLHIVGASALKSKH